MELIYKEVFEYLTLKCLLFHTKSTFLSEITIIIQMSSKKTSTSLSTKRC